MAMFQLKDPIGTDWRVDANDLMSTKTALSRLGDYDVPPHRGIDDWTDDALFDGIKRFQKDQGEGPMREHAARPSLACWRPALSRRG